MRKVEFLAMQQDIIPLERKTAYEFRRDRPCRWLQSLCFWILSNLKAYQIFDEKKITRYHINPDSFMEKIFRQDENLQREFHIKPTRMLIGSKNYAELMASPEIRELIRFDAQYHYGQDIYGLKVEIVPWMDGLLLMS